MSITFNADEIFEMAERIEKNGLKFYNKAAKIVSDKGMSKIFEDLAVMEASHVATFAAMRKELSDRETVPTAYDLDDQGAAYLKAMADGHVFDIKTDPSEQLTDKNTARDILTMAIRAEKDAVIFYEALKDFVPTKAGKEKVENILKEEQGHIALLSVKWAGLRY